MGLSTVPDLGSLALDALQEQLDAGPQGLSGAETARRLAQYGVNEITEERTNPLLTLAGYFWAPIPWMIEVALLLSVLVQRWADALIIGALLLMNGVVAFTEEHQAANAIEALKQQLAGTARVKRDGSWLVVPTRELVPGDVIRLRLGDVIPGDAKVLDEAQVEVDQSALTGESLTVTCARGATLLSGAVITRGECDALVYATGAASFFGRTTTLVSQAGTVSHFERAVLRIGNYLIVLALVLVATTLVVSLARGNALIATLEFALVVTIASIPVALPAVLSVTMAVGARQLAHRQAVVSHLPAVEELGSIDVLCSDKTGTLTQNTLTVDEPWCVPGISVHALMSAAALASRAEDQDLIDAAVLAAADGNQAAGPVVEQFTPFDPVSKRTAATVRMPDGDRVQVTKGAPQVISALCRDDPATAEANAQVAAFAAQGQRALAVAQTDPDGAWRLLGVLPIADPPRPDSAATVAAAQSLGVRVLMVTGDQVAIAARVAAQVGLGTNILAAADLDEQSDDSATSSQRVEHADGFAQVFPEHKYRIVALLQSRGHTVGMTGDGVNDAPALKQADAGIAVAGATDAARAAADVVLLAPGLSVIVEAIGLAREIFARMTSYATYRIAETIRVLLLVVLAVIVFNVFPVTATMIVLLAILNDGAILAIAYDHVRGSPRPASWDMRTVLTIATVLGVSGVLASFLLFAVARTSLGLSLDTTRTLLYLKLSVAGHLTIFLTRSRGPLWTPPAPSPLLLAAVLGTQLLATVIAAQGLFMTPIGWTRAGAVWLYALLWFLVNDRVKLATYSWLGRHPARRAPTSVTA